MAGLYLTIGPSSPTRLDAVATWMRFSNESEKRFHSSDLSYVWLGHDDPQRYAPAIDANTGVQVITGGRLVWSASEWQRAQQLPYTGGWANRVLLDRYLRDGITSMAPYNGAAVLILWDPRCKQLHLWTDQFGYHPAFVYTKSTSAPTVITTFPDAIRHDPELDCQVDHLSMAEFLSAWRATPPNTYYEYLKHALPANHWTWDVAAGTATNATYWRPFEGSFYRSSGEAAEALAVALRAAVSERTAAANKITFFVSGGADSRVMLFGADDPSKITGINLYETIPTPESDISKALCQRIGAKYVGHARDNDYYPRMLAENVRWSGCMWSSEDNHYLGVKHLVDESQADLVMTACTTDWVFKGYGLEKTYRTLFGKCLPLKVFLNQRVDGFLPNHPRPTPLPLRAAIQERMDRWFAGCPTELKDDLDFLRVEDRRIRPTCYTVSVSGQIMYRTFPYDTFLADSRVAECYAKIPAKMKLNSEVWGQAANRVCTGAGDIVDANFGWALDATPTKKLIAFGRGWISRRLKRLKPQPAASAPTNHPPCSASWPDLHWYIRNSPTIQQRWENATSAARARLSTYWGSDPWSVPLEQWASSSLDFFRLMTLLQYVEQQESGKCASRMPQALGTEKQQP